MASAVLSFCFEVQFLSSLDVDTLPERLYGFGRSRWALPGAAVAKDTVSVKYIAGPVLSDLLVMQASKLQTPAKMAQSISTSTIGMFAVLEVEYFSSNEST